MRAHRLKGILALGLLAAWLPAQAQTVRYVHTDALGSPVAMTDANRVVVQTRQYEPYGKRLNASNNDRPGYTGHVEDAATGLTYMQQRYYDPGIGRFLSVDPVTADSSTGANFNRYWYANNNPYRFTDPDGRAGMETMQETMAWGDADYVAANTMSAAEAKTGLGVVIDAAVSIAVDLALGGPSGEGAGVFATRRVARAADAAGDAKPLMGRNPKPGGPRTNTDAGPEGNRATARSIFRNQAEGKRTTTQMSNGGTRTRAENGVQIRHNPDGSSRVDLPNRGSAPNGESLHTPPPPPPPPPPRVR